MGTCAGIRRWARRGAVAVTLGLATTVASPGIAGASDAESAAGKLYDEGVEAQSRADFGKAARLFARADQLAPNPAALEAALRAAIHAGEAALGMALAERADARAPTGSLAEAAKEARRAFEARTGALRIECDGCRVAVDGEPISAGEQVWLASGEHYVTATEGSWSAARTVEVSPGASARLTLREPAAATDAPSPEDPGTARTRSGLSPAWFWVGLGGTVAAGAGTLASGLHTLSLHREFLAEPTLELADRGRAAETRTYVLAGLTGALGLATSLVGVLGVRWDARAGAAAFVVPAGDGLVGGMSGRF